MEIGDIVICVDYEKVNKPYTAYINEPLNGFYEIINKTKTRNFAQNFDDYEYVITLDNGKIYRQKYFKKFNYINPKLEDLEEYEDDNQFEEGFEL